MANSLSDTSALHNKNCSMHSECAFHAEEEMYGITISCMHGSKALTREIWEIIW